MGSRFDLLTGAENALASKKKNKKKPQQQPTEGDGHSGKPQGVSNEAGQGAGGVQDALQAVAEIEREARSASDKARLWTTWINQARDRSNRSTRFREPEGGFVDFRTVVLRSRGLEVSLEAAVEAAWLNTSHEELVGQLLGAFFVRLDPGSAAGLAHSLVQLSSLVAADGPDLQGAASRAVHAVVSALKSGALVEDAHVESPAASWAQRLTSLTDTISHERGQLQRLATSNQGAITKQHVDGARKIFRLTGEQLALLQSGAALCPPPSDTEAALATLASLGDTIAARLQAVSAPPDAGGKGGKAGSKGGDGGKAALIASLRKEEGVLATQGEALASQIRSLEAQLRSLRSQQQELETRRAGVLQRLHSAGDTGAGAGAKKGGAAGVPLRSGSPAHYQEELEVVERLKTLLAATDVTGGAGAVAHAAAAAAAAASSVSADYVASGRQVLEYAAASLSQIPARVAFCRQRQAQAEKLQRLGGKGNEKIKEDADRLLAEAASNAEELLRHSLALSAELNGRYEALAAAAREGAGEAALAESLRTVDGLLAEIRASYDAVQAQLRPPAPAPAPAPAPSGGRPNSAARTAPAAPPTAPAQPAPAPAPAPVPEPVAVAPAAAAPAPVAPPPAAPAAPKSAFDLAAEFLAQAKQPVVPVRVDAPAGGKPRATVGVVRPTSAATGMAPRSWGKPVASASAAAETEGDALPTPAEAFKKGK